MAGAAALLASVLTPTVATAAAGDVFVSEIHYDNDGTDVGEAIEVQAPVGTDLTGWSVVLYNGNDGATYDTTTLSGVVPDAGVVVVEYPSNGIQNGAPDGWALVDAAGAVVEFLSYEGTFAAVGGPADGMTSTDIGVEQGSTTPVGHSLQKVEGAWTGPLENSFGVLNGDGGTDPGPVDAFVSEIHYDNDGTDVGEAIEVQAPVGTDLTGWSVVLYNGSNGAVYSTTTLSGAVPDTGVVVVEYPTNGIQNGAPDGWALVDAAGAVVEFLSYEGTFIAVGGPADGMTSIDIGVHQPGTTPVGQSLQKVDGVWTGPLAQTFGTINGTDPGDPGDPGDPQVCTVEPTVIGAVQGDGDVSPVKDSSVTVRGTVVGDFQEGGFDGFYLQDAGDGDAATSDGIFVYAPGAADVAAGDTVAVTGTVKEHFGLTQVTSDVLEVCATDGELPAPTELVMPVLDHEPFEGMLISYPQDLAIQEYFEYGRYGEIVLGLGDATTRQFQPTAVYEPTSPERVALAEHNAAYRITLDDGLNDQNPAFLRHPNGEAFSLDNRFRGGDLVTGATGVMDYRFNEWKVQPTAPAEYTAVNERPAVPEVGGTTTIGSFNVLNYFTTLGSRGADTDEEFERQEAKIVAAINAMDTDVVGLIEIENNGDVAVGTLVDALNEAAGTQKWAFVSTGVIGTDAITTAFIYQPDEVATVGDFAVLDSSVDPRFNDDKNRPALAQTFADLETGGQVTVVNNHLKSKGSDCDALGDPEDPNGQANCNLTRLAAADALGDWANGDPTGTGTEQVLIIGDLNSYDKEDPIDALKADGYSDLLLTYVGEYAYSYVFDGQLGYLDYAMANSALSDRVTGAQVWNINADEPSVLDYDLTFKPTEQAVLYAPNPYRSSDHDPVLVGLDLSQDGPDTTAPELEVIAGPPHIWPANGKMRNLTTVVLATDDSGEEPVVTLVGATTEGGEIEVLDDHRFRVRAVLGATYTLTYEATDAAGNATTTSVTVEVAKPGKGGGQGQGRV